MHNVYFPGDKLFLYAAFEKGLKIITQRTEASQLAETDDSKNGLYINGEWVSYEEYMRYYSDYLIDPSWDTTYYAYNSYYSNAYLNGYLNWTSPYYVRSLEDTSEEKDEIIEIITHKMQCRILHDEDGEIYEDLSWTDMLKMGDNEFYYVFCIPYDFSASQYQVIYKSIYNVSYYNGQTKEQYDDEELDALNFGKHNVNKIANSLETFYIAERSETYEDVVKIFGNVNYQRTTIPAEDTRVSIYENDSNIKVYQSLTDREGNWEAYVYPNNYRLVFHRNGYNDEVIYAEVNDETNQLPFQTVSLGKGQQNNGNGLYRVFDKYITKNGQSLNGLEIKIYDVNDPTTIIAETTTNDDGIWEVYIDDGFYILKISGTSMNANFDRVFRLRVNQDGEYHFDNVTANVLTDDNMPVIMNGYGSILIEDTVTDRWNNPIPDIQVNIYNENSKLLDENIIAQCYTDSNGKYIFHLDPGTYIFEFYHPNYKTVTSNKTINIDGTITEE